MANSIVGGLFGIDPAQYQQQKEAIANQQALQFAEMDPFQRANYGMFRGGQQLGQAASGLMGTQDPQLQAAGVAQKLASQFDITTPNGLRQYAAALQEAAKTSNNPALLSLASMASEKAQEAQTKGIEALKKSEETRLLGRQTVEIGVPGNAEMMIKAIVDKDGNIIQYVGKPYSRYSQKSTTYVDARNVGEKEFSKELGKLDAKQVNAGMELRNNAINSLKSLSELKNLNSNELISGQFAAGRVGAANLMQTLGLASDVDAKRLANSQQYQKVSGDVALQMLGGKLGTGYSNDDRKFVVGLVPQLETSATARKQLIDFMAKKQQDIIQETTRMEKYAREHNGLSGFVPTIPIFEAGKSSSKTLDEIDAKLKALGYEGK